MEREKQASPQTGKNPFHPETQPISHAEWEKAWHKKNKPHKETKCQSFQEIIAQAKKEGRRI